MGRLNPIPLALPLTLDGSTKMSHVVKSLAWDGWAIQIVLYSETVTSRFLFYEGSRLLRDASLEEGSKLWILYTGARKYYYRENGMLIGTEEDYNQ